MKILFAGAKPETKSEPFSDPRQASGFELNLMSTYFEFQNLSKTKRRFLKRLAKRRKTGKCYEEFWEWVVNYHGYYKVSDRGRIKSVERIVINNGGEQRKEERILKPGKDGNGYAAVALCKNGRPKTVSVAKLVLEAFVGPRPDGYEICHRNDIKTDSRLKNLYWGTPNQNREDRASNGIHTKGERNGSAKLTEEKVKKIRRLYKTGKCKNFSHLAKRFGVNRQCIANLIYRKTWTHIKEN